MAAEAIEGTMQDLVGRHAEGQKGYVIGRIVFEVGTLVFPAAKAEFAGKAEQGGGHQSPHDEGAAHRGRRRGSS
jgi:hypothetical protein